MEKKKALTTVIYDNAGTLYYLIFQDKNARWVLPKALSKDNTDISKLAEDLARQVTSLQSLKATHKIQPAVPIEYEGTHYDFEIFLIEASMNSPILIKQNTFETYLWGTYDRCAEKLTSQEEKFILQKSHESLSAQISSGKEEAS